MGFQLQESDAPDPQVANSFTLTIDDDYYSELGSAEAMSDSVLSTTELLSDPDGVALLEALSEQIASSLGQFVLPGDISIYVSPSQLWGCPDII